METLKTILTLIVWAVLVGMVVMTIVRDYKEIRCMKGRRELLDEVCDYLHDVVAVSGRNLEGHMEFMQKFRDKFREDRF